MTEEIKPDKVRRGRTSRWKFTQTPQWALLMTELSDAGYRIYSVLIAHVNATDDDGEAWPQQETIGKMLARRREAVSRVITKELVPLGLVDVEVERYGTNNSRRRNIYTVHELPPEDFTGWASTTEWYQAHPRPKPATINRRERKSAGQPGRAKNRTSGDAEDRASGGAKKRTGMTPTPNETKGDSSSPPSPPSSTDGAASPGTAGREEENSTKKTDTAHLERAQALVDDAVRLWPRNHKAPSAKDRHRLSERVADELTNGGDETVIVHEISRDLQVAGSAVRVVLGSRTKASGWGQAADPRPDHSRYEVRTKTPWCGTCDERTRQVVVRDEDGGNERMARCRQCHPEADRTIFEDQGEEHAETDPALIEQMRASLAEREAKNRERKERELAATKKLLASIRSGAEREESARLSRG